MLSSIYKQIAQNVMKARHGYDDKFKAVLRTDSYVEVDKIVEADPYIGEAVRALRERLGTENIVLPHGFTDYVKCGGMLDLRDLATEIQALPSDTKADIIVMTLMAMYDRAKRAGNAETWSDVDFDEVMRYYMYLEPIADALKLTVSRDLIRDAWARYWE